MTNPETAQVPFPAIRTVGLTGMLVSFADQLTEPSNRAALAFRDAVDALQWPGVEETSTSLASTFVRYDPLFLNPAQLRADLAALVDSTDWYRADPPRGRRFWRIPTVYGGDLAPQLGQTAELAGLSEIAAAQVLSRARVRVLTLGFAAGQPYLGQLPDVWNIPRQTDLTPRVPEGALVLAIRQFVLFTAPAPTGWRHVGQTAFRGFRPEQEQAFALRSGDEVEFVAVDRAEFETIRTRDTSGNGGATAEVIL
jgi:KipI family sensor histidine kinase inhibitor